MICQRKTRKIPNLAALPTGVKQGTMGAVKLSFGKETIYEQADSGLVLPVPQNAAAASGYKF
jgi:hypothetical protein